MIKFKRIEWENFLSFYGSHEYNFYDDNIHWIKGVNIDSEQKTKDGEEHSVGSGKSSFTFVLQYGLFGQIEKKIKKKDQIINKDAKRNLYVGVEFYHEKNLYRVRRYRKHTDYKDDLFLEMMVDNEWKDLTSTSKEATQKEIDDLTSMTPDTFLKSILFSREDEKQFFKLTNAERIKIFESLIQLNKFDKYIKRLKKKLKKGNELLTSLERDEASIKSALKIHTQNYKTEKASIENRLEEIDEEIKDLLNKLEEEIDVEEVLKKIEEYKAITAEIEEIDRLKELDELALENCETKIESNQNDIKKAKKEIEKIKEKISTTEDTLNDLEPITCHNCNAIQNEEGFQKQKDQIIQMISNYRSQIDNKIKDIVDYGIVIDTEDKKLLELKPSVKERELILKDKKEKRKEINLDTKYIKIKKEDLLKIKEVNKEIEQLKFEKSFLNFDKADSYKEQAKAEKIKLEKFVIDIAEQKVFIEKVEWLINAFNIKSENSIKSFIMSKVIPVFNKIVQSNLDVAFDGDVSILVDQELNETIIKEGDEYDYSEFSTGEKTKVNLCTNLSIFDMTRFNLSGSNVLFFDEVFSNIDAPTTKKFLNIIKDKYASKAGTYIISHDKTVEMNIKPLSSIIIEKFGGRSSLKIKKEL